MPGTDAMPAAGSPLLWRTVEICELIEETARTRSLVLNVPGWPSHRPGQHVDIRLTAEDGYQAQRSYSIASPPETKQLMVTIDRIDGGEVSPYLTTEVRIGDRFELRGPIGGYFVWTVALGGPLFLVAGGSGIVPLMAMLRHRAAVGGKVPTTLLYSSRGYDGIIYRTELDRLAARDDGLKVFHTLTRQRPPGWTGFSRRIDRNMLAEVGGPADGRSRVYICGPTPLVEQSAQLFLALGHQADSIKTERFGPTGA